MNCATFSFHTLYKSHNLHIRGQDLAEGSLKEVNKSSGRRMKVYIFPRSQDAFGKQGGYKLNKR